MTMAEPVLSSSYDIAFVALSLLVAVFASYVALSLAERTTLTQGAARGVWLLGGSCVLGLGIWSMHFTGMLAFRLPVPIAYDIPTVALSLLAAILSSAMALVVVTRRSFGMIPWLVSGLVMGGGVTSMHYIGMSAMRLSAVPVWDWRVVAASIAIAVAASLTALRLTFKLRTVPRGGLVARRCIAALVMGAAIGGMHYCGMAAAHFAAMPQASLGGFVVSTSKLGVVSIVTGTLLVLVVALAIVYVDRLLTANRLVLTETQSHFRAIVSGAPVILFALDASGRITMAQGRDLESIGFDSALEVGRSFVDAFAEFPQWAADARRGLTGEGFSSVTRVADLVIEMRWTPLGAEHEGVVALVAVGTNVTERCRFDEALQHQALHDVLTGLPNRTSFAAKVPAEIAGARVRGECLGIAVVDLNRFRVINDSLGHDLGDVLLRSVSERIASVLRSSDIVARLGGDEFALLLCGPTRSSIVEIAERVIGSFEEPFLVGAHVLRAGAAIGLAFSFDGADATLLMRQAEVAMYVAKGGKLDVATYDERTDSEATTRLLIENGLRHAISSDQLVLHYQPTVDFRTGRAIGAEALVRWKHPTLGLLQPDAFVPLAEEMGAITALTRWVLDAALAQIRAWLPRYPWLRMAVNVSTRDLCDTCFPQAVADLLRLHAVPAGALTLEVTESSLIADTKTVLRVLTQLSDLGVRISIDDFGTGYSSLAYLSRLPADEIKIDKSFVLGMRATQNDASIVRWITELGHHLHMNVVAEGIEDIETFRLLRNLGCDVAQGYFLTRPLPRRELEVWLDKTQSTAGEYAHAVGE